MNLHVTYIYAKNDKKFTKGSPILIFLLNSIAVFLRFYYDGLTPRQLNFLAQFARRVRNRRIHLFLCLLPTYIS